jgi:iron uptake system component EfeO
MRLLALASLAAVAAVFAACGSDDSSSKGGKKVAVELTSSGCPKALKAAAGPTTFVVTNKGSSQTEFEILDGSLILAEKENIADGLSGSFSLDLKPGKYGLRCTAAGDPTGTLVVTGSSSSASNPQLTTAVSKYDEYVTDQAKKLGAATTAFTDAVRAGDVEKAKKLYAPTRQFYERIEPVAESFGDLDPAIDARVNDVEQGQTWTGFHRIEQGLWVKNSTKGLDKFADQLDADVKRLQARVAAAKYQPAQLANGAVELLNEVSKSKITGEEDRYSHTDLVDFEANVQGAQEAFELLRPALAAKDPQLAKTVSTRFAAVMAALAPYRKGEAVFVDYSKVTPAQRRKLSQAVDALAEPLSHIGGTVVAG